MAIEVIIEEILCVEIHGKFIDFVLIVSKNVIENIQSMIESLEWLHNRWSLNRPHFKAFESKANVHVVQPIERIRTTTWIKTRLTALLR